MEFLLSLIIALILVLHIYFVWLEMFAWTTHGKKAFRGLPDEFFVKTKPLAANQGLYNGFLVAGLVWSLLIDDLQWAENIAIFFLSCIAVAGIYGGLTAQKSSFYVQGAPAIIAIVLILTM